jgi:hypothetical protein
MRRSTRTAPLFIAMVAALAFAVPGYGALTAPTGTTTTVGEPVPAFSWTPVTGADHYTFELDSGATLGTPLITITGIKNTRATLTQTISDGPYTWRVRAVTATGTNGPWSNAVNWTKTGTGPTLISPAPAATITYPSPVLLQWAPVDGAYQYIVSIADSSNMANAVTATTEATGYSPGSWLPPGVHYWTVTAKDSRGNPVGTSPGATGSAFTWVWPSTVSGLSVASAIDISAGVTAQWTMYDPQFSWTPVPGAVKYQVEVNTDDISWSNGSKMCCSDTIATTLTPTGLLPNATYAWRVRAVDASGYAGAWSVGDQFGQSYDSFVTAPPSTPSVPNLRMADNVSDPGIDFAPGTAGYQTQVPIVKWDPVPGASGYDVMMVQYTGGQCQWTGAGTRWSARTAATAYTPVPAATWNNLTPWPSNGTSVTNDSNDLTPGMGYCVRVTPFRDTANTGGFSTIDVSGDPTYLDPNDDGSVPAFTFDSLPTGNPCSVPCTSGYLGAADYNGPITGSTPSAVPLFTWNPVAGANGYFVIVARDQAFNTIVDYAFTHLPAYAPRSGSAPRTYQNQSTHYYWVVLPSTGANGSGAVVNPQSGHPQSFDRPQVGPTPIAPANAAVVTGSPTFSWNPIDGARKYELVVSQDPNFKATPLEDVTTSNTSYTSLSASYPADTDLFWEVQAIDYNGLKQPFSVSRTFHQTWPTPSFVGVTNPTAGDTVPVLSWKPVTGAVSYDVHVDQPGNGPSDSTGLATTAFVPSAIWGLGDFTWTVRANFANGFGSPTHGPWTAPQIFTRSIHAPTGLTTLAPTGTAHVPVLLSWGWKAGAKTYKVEVSRDSSFVSSVESAEIDTSSWAPLMSATDYSNGGLLYWHVQAIDSHGTHGTWSPATPLVFANKLVPTASTTVIPHGATATITITVKDGTGHVVPGAKVTVSGAGVIITSKLTGSTGKAAFKVHPTKAGKIKFAATKSGCVSGVVYTSVY